MQILIGTFLELHAHHFAELCWSIRLDGPGVRVAVTAGGDAGHARGEDPRTQRLTTGDRRLQGEVGMFAFTRQTDRRHTCQECLAGVASHAQRQRRLGFELHAVLIRTRKCEPEVDVHVDQSRQHMRAGQIDNVGLVRLSRELFDRTDACDAVAVDQHATPGRHTARYDVDHRAVGENSL